MVSLTIGRSTDFALVLLVMYSLSSLVPALPPRLALTVHFLHALSWRLFHSFGLGLLLRAQSKTKWVVRHYLKHYHYPGDASMDSEEEGKERESVVKRATEEAFGNWQVAYNISLVMTYGESPFQTPSAYISGSVSFAGLAWKTYHLPMDWTVSGTILRHVLGFVNRLLSLPLRHALTPRQSLIALHVWSAISSYEVLGDFGESQRTGLILESHRSIYRLAVLRLLPHRADPFSIGLHRHISLPQ